MARFLCIVGDVSWSNGEWGRGAVAQVGEAEPGPMGAQTGEWSAVVRKNLTEFDDFPLEQSQDETLKNAFDQVRSIDGQPLQLTQPLS